MSATAGDRLARAALSRLGEPGDPRLAALVTELGAGEVYAYLRDERDASGVATDVAARLPGARPGSRARGGRPARHPVHLPGGRGVAGTDR